MENSQYLFFRNTKQAETLLYAGSIILGVSIADLGVEYVTELDDFVSSLPDYLQDEIQKLFRFFNSKIFSFLLIRTLKSFNGMNRDQQEKYIKKWMNSRLNLLRSGYVTLRSLAGWGYYTQGSTVKNEMNFQGKPLRKENKVPTLLYGKEPYKRA